MSRKVPRKTLSFFREPRLPGRLEKSSPKKIVRRAARLLVAVERRRVGSERDAKGDLHVRCVDFHDLPLVAARDEARHVHVLAVLGHGDTARPRADVDRGEDVSGCGVELGELAGAISVTYCSVPRRAHREADRLRRIRKPESSFDREAIQVDDRDRVVVPVHHPELSGGRDRERDRPLVNGNLGEGRKPDGVGDADAVVVFVDVADALSHRVVHDVGRRARRSRRDRVVHDVHEGDAREVRLIFDRDDERVVPRLRVRVRYVARACDEIGRRAVPKFQR